MFKHLPVPLNVYVGLTNKCNLNCTYCSVNPRRKEYDEDLSTQEWKDFYDYLADKKVLKTYISGGEPFVRSDIFEILDHISKKPIFIDGINTNGTLIDEAGAKKLGKYKKINVIAVSLDGASADIHDETRGKGSFDKTIKGIKNLIKYGSRVSTSATITKINMHDIDNMLELGMRLKVRTMRFSPVMILGNALENQVEVGLSKDDMKELMGKVAYWKKKYDGYFTGIFLDMYEMEKRRKEDILNVAKDAPVRTFIGCKMILNKCVMRGDGWVIPCDRLWDMKAGNIRQEDFLEIWNNSEVFREIRKKYKIPIDKIPECKECEYNRICTGGCPATMYDITGDIWGFDAASCYKYIAECMGEQTR